MRKSHTIAYFLICFVVGVGFQSVFRADFLLAIILMFLGIFSAGVVWWVSPVQDFTHRYRHISKRYRVCVLLLGLVFLAFGMVRIEVSHHVSCEAGNGSSVTCLNGSTQVFVSLIVSEPDVRAKNIQYKLLVEGFEGKILLFGPHFPVYEYGAHLLISCHVEYPEAFEGFDYPGFLAKEGVYAVCFQPESIEQVLFTSYAATSPQGIKQRLLKSKAYIKSIIDHSVSYPQSTFVNSLLLGLKREVPESIQDQFAYTGTSHIMAISGLHVVILTSILFSVFRSLRIPKKHSFAGVVFLLLLFVGIIGFKSSAIRAVVFGFVAILAEATGRPKQARNVLLLAAVILLLYNPLLLIHDVGFQLSFLAVLGLIYVGPLLKHISKRIPDVLGIRSILVMTISANALVVPLLAYHFSSLSLIAPLANVLVLPVIPLIMLCSIILVVLGSVWPTLGVLVGALVSHMVSYVLFVTRHLSEFPVSHIEQSLSFQQTLLVYIISMSILLGRRYIKMIFDKTRRLVTGIGEWISMKRMPRYVDDGVGVVSKTYSLDYFEEKSELEPNTKKTFMQLTKKHLARFRALVAMLFAAAIAVVVLFNPAPDEFKVVFFDVGQGDSHLITTPGGHAILIDGGPGNAILSKLDSYLPVGSNTIDLMVLTHPHADHVSGLNEVLKRYEIERVLATGVSHTTDTYLEWLSHIEKQDIQFDQAIASLSYTFESDLGDTELTVIYPFEDISAEPFKDLNESSVVLLLEYQGNRFLFTGDISVENEAQILASGADISADVLKVAHQGSDTSSSIEFLEAVSANYSVIPVGENSYGHPSLRVIDRLMGAGSKVLRTDQDGDVVFGVSEDELELTHSQK